MKKIIKITLITITTLIILVFTYFIIMGIILATAFNGNYSKKLMKQYQEKEIRINYFKQHEKDFTIIVKTFENYSEINGIKSKYNPCYANETEIKANHNTFCVENTSKRKNEIKNINIDNEIKNLSKIVEIIKRKVYDDNSNEIDSAISFYLITSVNNSVHYNYCLSEKECDSEEDSHKTTKGIYIKNKINSKWSSIYNTIPQM